MINRQDRQDRHANPTQFHMYITIRSMPVFPVFPVGNKDVQINNNGGKTKWMNRKTWTGSMRS